MDTQGQDKSNNVFLMVIKYGLVVYTALRSVDLVTGTMPESIKTFAVLVVCGLDLAFLAWDNYAAHKAKNASQHTVGVAMIVVDLIGIGLALIADTATVIDPVNSRQLIMTVALFAIPILVIANIGALSAIDQMDPDRKAVEDAALHKRELAALRAKHDREIQKSSQGTQLDLERLANDQRLKDLQDHYMRGRASSSGNGSGKGHAPEMGTLAVDGEEVGEVVPAPKARRRA